MTDHPDPTTVTPVPNAEGTPRRSVRIPDERWDLAKEAADYFGETMTDAINEFLDDYNRRYLRMRARQRDRGPEDD